MSGDIATAYDAITKRKQDSGEISAHEKSRYRYSRLYHFQEGVKSCPHVCMCIPTADGKTYMKRGYKGVYHNWAATQDKIH